MVRKAWIGRRQWKSKRRCRYLSGRRPNPWLIEVAVQPVCCCRSEIAEPDEWVAVNEVRRARKRFWQWGLFQMGRVGTDSQGLFAALLQPCVVRPDCAVVVCYHTKNERPKTRHTAVPCSYYTGSVSLSKKPVHVWFSSKGQGTIHIVYVLRKEPRITKQEKQI